jgi:NAD(P)-dependent dehydrogenase (short-subunit alcohol dehydrogenase family)
VKEEEATRVKGKILLITGATSGIGKETARGLAHLGATVVIATRGIQRGEQTKQELILSTKNNNIDVIYCDLASFESIRGCCTAFLKKYDALHVLINNAGIVDYHRRESKDGVENTFAVNYLAPFLMTNLLLDVLKKKAHQPESLISPQGCIPERFISMTSNSNTVFQG